MPRARILVTGAGGFIGHHLVSFLKTRGYWVRGADLKAPEFATTDADEFLILDLRRRSACLEATKEVDQVFALAADMGGMGFISGNDACIVHNNLLMNTHTLEAARQNHVERYLYTSSACVYPEHLQTAIDAVPLREEDAYPAAPQDGYGWEKLISERLCQYYHADYGMETRIARFHSIFGPLGTWEGGREKVPAALCRKVAIAKLSGAAEIEIWGDGRQTRSFCYIDDCVEGLHRLMSSNHHEPLNLGQDQLISINDLADLIIEASGIRLEKRHVEGPEGVRGRNSDNDRLANVLDWTPQIPLRDGIRQTYRWIEAQVRAAYYPDEGSEDRTGASSLETDLVVSAAGPALQSHETLRAARGT